MSPEPNQYGLSSNFSPQFVREPRSHRNGPNSTCLQYLKRERHWSEKTAPCMLPQLHFKNPRSHHCQPYDPVFGAIAWNPNAAVSKKRLYRRCLPPRTSSNSGKSVASNPSWYLLTSLRSSAQLTTNSTNSCSSA